jgi:hypothetical protein
VGLWVLVIVSGGVLAQSASSLKEVDHKSNTHLRVLDGRKKLDERTHEHLYVRSSDMRSSGGEECTKKQNPFVEQPCLDA